MILQSAMAAGVDFNSALHMPLSMLEDIIATDQIMNHGYNRILTDPEDQEREFLIIMSKR